MNGAPGFVGLVGVVLPEVFQGFGESLGFGGVVYVAGIFCEEELVGVVFGCQRLGHVFVGYYPVVHVVVQGSAEVVAVSDFKPEAEGLAVGFGDEGLVEAPGALRSRGVPGPLLVDVGARIGEDAVVEVRMVPGHDEGAGASGAAAHGGAGVGVVGEADVGLRFDQGEDFVLYELGVVGGEGVVFEAALGALGVAAAVADGDGDHGGEFVGSDKVVEDGEEEVVGAVGADDEGGDGAGDVLRGDVDGDVARVGRGMAGGDDEAGGVGGVGCAEGAFVAGYAGIIFAVSGGHGDVGEGALRDVGVDGGLWRGGVRGAEDEVAVLRGRGEGVVGEVGGGDVAGGVGVADGWGFVRLGQGWGCGGKEEDGGAEGAGHVGLR